MTKYAVYCDDKLIEVFVAASLAEAVEMNNQSQAAYNDLFGCNEVFQLHKATTEQIIALADKLDTTEH